MSDSENTNGSGLLSEESDIDLDSSLITEGEAEEKLIAVGNCALPEHSDVPSKNQSTSTKGMGSTEEKSWKRKRERPKGSGGKLKEQPPPPMVPVWTEESEEPVIHEWSSPFLEPGPSAKVVW